MKLSIRSKVILIFTSIFLITSIFTGFFYVKLQKERKFEAIREEVKILAEYYEEELFEIGQHNWDEYRLINQYLRVCDSTQKQKTLKDKVVNVKKLSSDLVSIKICRSNGNICVSDDLGIQENKVYHKLVDSLSHKDCRLEVLYELSINLKSTSKNINYYLMKFNNNMDSVAIMSHLDNTKMYDIDSVFVRDLLKGYTGYIPSYTRNIIIGEKPKGHKISNKKNIDLNYYIYDSLLDFIFVVEANEDEIRADINKSLVRDILVNYIGIFILVIGLIYFTLKYIIKDIYTVKDALNEITSGNLSHRIEHTRVDEIGELMDKFNVMSKNLEEEVINNVNLEKMNNNLQEEHDKYRALLDSSFEAIFLSDKGFCIDCNKAACKMFGYKYEEMLKIFGTDIISDADKDTVRKNMLSEYEIPYKATGKRKDGTEFPILLRGKMFTYRGKQLRATSAIDISSATKLEEANKDLNEEINKFKVLLDVSDDGIVLMSLEEQKVVQVNKALFTIFGMEEGEIIEKYKHPMELMEAWIHPDSIEKLKKHFLKEIPYTVKLLRIDGTTFDCRIKAKNITLGGKRYRISVLRDITDKTTIQNYAHKLEKSNKELEQFAYIASHDLQEPIRTITSFLELFEERYYDKVDQDGKEFISYIMVAAHKQRKLINDLLRYSRLDTKREIREQDLNQILELTMMNLNRLIDEKHAVISSKTLPKMNCDFTQISQVFENLIKNAIKFNDNNPHITIDFEDRVDEVLFIFEDNGVGIDEKYHEKIFQAFQRLSNDDSGTGIGLAIVNKVVENHGGKIWLESSDSSDDGSKFYFTISKNLKTT